MILSFARRACDAGQKTENSAETRQKMTLVIAMFFFCFFCFFFVLFPAASLHPLPPGSWLKWRPRVIVPLCRLNTIARIRAAWLNNQRRRRKWKMPENLWQKCAPDQDRGINTVPQQPSRSPTNNTLKVCRNIEILYNGEKMQQKKK